MRRRLTDEDGFVAVLAIIVLAIVLVLVGTAVEETLVSRSFASKDTRVKRALAAADAGIQTGLYRANEISLANTDFNGGLSGIVNTLNCISPVSASGTLVLGGGTPTSVGFAGSTGTCVPNHCLFSCPSSPPALPPCAQPYTALGESSGFGVCEIYGSVINGDSVALQPRLVSIGFDRNGATDVVRRVEAILSPIDPFQAIEATGNLTFHGAGLSATTINGDVRTDGDWTVSGLSGVNGLNLLGPGGGLARTAHFQYGPGGSLNRGVLSLLPAPTRLQSNFTRQTISVASSKPDCPSGLSTNCPTGYVPATHSFSLSAGQVANFASGDYVFCNFNAAANSTVTTATSGGPVRIFIDSPQSSRCSGVSGAGNFSASTVLNGLVNSSLLDPRNLQIYVAGNCDSNGQNCTGPTSSVSLNAGGVVLGGVNQSFFLYAPKSTVNITFPALASTFEGSIIGQDVTLNTSVATVITQDLRLNDMPLASGVGVFGVQQYIECQPEVPAAADVPNKDC
jgi:hypothetical protein